MYRLLALFILCHVPLLSATAPQDSLLRQEAMIRQLEDSLELGISQLERAWQRQETLETDSLRHVLEKEVAIPWKTWADERYGPWPGVEAAHFYRFADLYDMLDRFDMVGAYDRQLDCYRWASRYPGEAFQGTAKLHAQYHRVGFAPGMIQAGLHLINLDEELALRSGIAKSLAQAYYFVGDRKEALHWVKRHLKVKPDDPDAQELKKKIRALRKN